MVGDERGIESRAGVPPPVRLGIEATHEGVSNIMGCIGVAVEVHYRHVAVGARQRQHRPVPQGARDHEGEEQRGCNAQGEDLAMPGDATSSFLRGPDIPYKSPEQIQQSQAEQKSLKPAHTQHGDAVPEGKQRRQNEVEPGGVEVKSGGESSTGRV